MEQTKQGKIWGYILAIVVLIALILVILFVFRPGARTLPPEAQVGQLLVAQTPQGTNGEDGRQAPSGTVTPGQESQTNQDVQAQLPPFEVPARIECVQFNTISTLHPILRTSCMDGLGKVTYYIFERDCDTNALGKLVRVETTSECVSNYQLKEALPGDGCYAWTLQAERDGELIPETPSSFACFNIEERQLLFDLDWIWEGWPILLSKSDDKCSGYLLKDQNGIWRDAKCRELAGAFLLARVQKSCPGPALISRADSNISFNCLDGQGWQ